MGYSCCIPYYRKYQNAIDCKVVQLIVNAEKSKDG